jgi:hypothetical protein
MTEKIHTVVCDFFFYYYYLRRQLFVIKIMIIEGQSIKAISRYVAHGFVCSNDKRN